jgi:hypothetical protein
MNIQQAFEKLSTHVDLTLKNDEVHIQQTFPSKESATPVVRSIATYFEKKCGQQVAVNYSYTGPKCNKVKSKFP